MSQVTSTGTCKTCGATIIWSKRDTRWNPPLEASSARFGFCILDDGTTIQSYHYDKHMCKVDDIAAWEIVTSKLDAAKAPREVPTTAQLAEEEGVLSEFEAFQAWLREQSTRAAEATSQAQVAHDETKRQYAEAAHKRWEEGEAHWAEVREARRDADWDFALKRKCEKCGASRGVKCWNGALHLIKKGIKEHTKNPHPVRLDGQY